MTTATPFSDDLIKEFVLAGHGNLERVRELLTEHPGLLTVEYDWGPDNTTESALDAAGHVRHREIAEFLLAQGAPLTIYVAAMLGRSADVARMLDSDPALVNRPGVHGFSLLYHTALSGDVALADLIFARGGRLGIDASLYPAAGYGHLDMVRWLLDHGATNVNTPNFQAKTPLTVAEERGHKDIAALLRAHGGSNEPAKDED